MASSMTVAAPSDRETFGRLNPQHSEFLPPPQRSTIAAMPWPRQALAGHFLSMGMSMEH
jgi:hypothetical protein